MSDPESDQLSQALGSTFAELGINPPFVETILLRDRCYVGRKYRAGGYQIVWWVEANSLEIFDQDGQSTGVIGLEKNSEKISA
jgi:hypothetical protein